MTHEARQYAIRASLQIIYMRDRYIDTRTNYWNTHRCYLQPDPWWTPEIHQIIGRGISITKNLIIFSISLVLGSSLSISVGSGFLQSEIIIPHQSIQFQAAAEFSATRHAIIFSTSQPAYLSTSFSTLQNFRFSKCGLWRHLFPLI